MNEIKRASGALMHVSSLNGEFSEGSLGKEAFEWIDFLAECGFRVWQVLPFCLPDEYNSPYKSLGAFSTNPFFIDLPSLFEEGLITKDELCASRQDSPYLCEFKRMNLERTALLRKAALRFKDEDKIEKFMENHHESEKFCEFMALRAANNDMPWNKWETNIPDPVELKMRRFTEYTFHKQWKKVKEYANKKGISVIGDIPMYVSWDSADVYSNSDEFLLDKRKEPCSVAGVPPDYFCKDGQLWGNPLYDWKKMKKNGFSWWRKRIRFMCELFDGVRIDHFRAVESFFKIPAKDTTARNGKWVKGPGEPLIKAIKEESEGKLIIAEDLGDITDDVRELVRKSGFPGMRVLQFAFLGGDTPHLPHNFENNSVAYTGTHDNNTLLGYIWEMSPDERKRLFDYIGYTGDDLDGCYEDIMRLMLQSHAGLVIFPVQDLLFYGRDTRLNTPGAADGNWSYRITKEQLSRIDKNRLRKWNEMYGRCR